MGVFVRIEFVEIKFDVPRNKSKYCNLCMTVNKVIAWIWRWRVWRVKSARKTTAMCQTARQTGSTTRVNRYWTFKKINSLRPFFSRYRCEFQYWTCKITAVIYASLSSKNYSQNQNLWDVFAQLWALRRGPGALAGHTPGLAATKPKRIWPISGSNSPEVATEFPKWSWQWLAMARLV